MATAALVGGFSLDRSEEATRYSLYI
jgi:hypothetical protein